MAGNSHAISEVHMRVADHVLPLVRWPQLPIYICICIHIKNTTLNSKIGALICTDICAYRSAAKAASWCAMAWRSCAAGNFESLLRSPLVGGDGPRSTNGDVAELLARTSCRDKGRQP